jgi:hypothetical protein
MNATRQLKRIVTGTALSGRLAAAGLRLAGAAQADMYVPYQWSSGPAGPSAVPD